MAILMATILLTNGSIFIKLLFKNMFFYALPIIPPLPIQPTIELQTFSSSQPTSLLAETVSSQNSFHSISVGLVAGMVTVMVVLMNQINLFMLIMNLNSNLPQSLMLDLLISTLLPLGWCLANREIFRLGGGRMKQLVCRLF